MNDYSICSFSQGKENDVFQLIKNVFDEFVAPDYSQDGNEFFYSYIDPACIIERFNNGNLILTASFGNEIIGMIEVRDWFHICLLFVSKNHQRKGISRLLFEKALNEILNNKPEIRFIEVNASPFSVEIYKRLGFNIISERQERNGIIYIPMILTLSR